LFLESSNGEVSINIYRNGTLIESTPQSQWNVDKLDGSGTTTGNGAGNRSRLNIDWTKDQIFFFDFQWLGSGRIRWGFVHDGDFIIFHESKHANNIQKVYMASPNHSLRWEVRSTGGAGSMTHICGSVETEGAINENGYGFDISNTNALSAPSSGNTYCALAWRFKTDNYNRIVKFLNASLLGTSNDSYRVRLLINPTIAGALTWIDKVDTPIEYAIGATTNTVTGGFSLGGRLFYQQTTSISEQDSSLRLGTKINGTSDIMALVVTPLSAGLSYHASVNLREII